MLVPVELVENAVKALLKHSAEKKIGENEKESLFDEDKAMLLLVSVKDSHPTKKVSAIPLSIPHPLYTRPGVEVCVFSRNGDDEKLLKNAQDEGLETITRVMSLNTLKTEFNQFKDRRDLVNSYDLFLADHRIIPTLPPFLGKVFFSRKKHPMPVKLNRPSGIKDLKKALKSTQLFLNGNVFAIKIGKTDFESNEIVENINAVIEQLVDRFSSKIHTIHLKTVDSISLPLYNSLLKDASAEDAVNQQLDVVPIAV